MKNLVLLFAFLTATSMLAACGSHKGEGNSAFKGYWVSDNFAEIKSKPDDICNRVQNNKYTNNKNELEIDIFRIDGHGGVHDYNTDGSQSLSALWAVSDSGAVSNDIVAAQDNDEDFKIVGHSMKKVDDNTILNIYQLKSKDGTTSTAENKYVRTSPEELKTVDALVQKCKVN